MSSGYDLYILRCVDGSLYTGIAVDAQKRAAVHNSGRGAKYTRSRLPVTVVYTERFAEKGDALRRELAVKALSRAEKLALIEGEAEGTEGGRPSFS